MVTLLGLVLSRNLATSVFLQCDNTWPDKETPETTLKGRDGTRHDGMKHESTADLENLIFLDSINLM